MRLRYIWPAVILVAAACTPDADPTPAPVATASPAAVVTDAPATAAPATDAPATDAPATDAPATDAPAVGANGAIAGLPAECVSPPSDVAIRRSGAGENETVTVADAEDAGNAVRDGGAIGYKIFLTDFEIDDDEGLIGQVFLDALPEGSTLITLDLGRFEDSEDPTPVEEYPNIAAGEDLAHSNTARGPDIVAAQVTIATAEGTTTSTSTNSVATGEILYADDTAVCADVTIESENGFQFSGIVSARVR